MNAETSSSLSTVNESTDAAAQAAATPHKGPVARLPTEHGEFQVCAYLDEVTGVEHVVLWMGDVAGAEVLLRMHSECLTGDVFASRRCDCGPQLQMAMQRIAQAGRGVLIYMRGHEGRGIGIGQKLRAYALQDQGLDTVEANLVLGHPVDARRYEAAAAILRDLQVRSVRLMSNNPLKLASLQQQGIEVVQREPHEVAPNPDNSSYLATKRERLGHWLGD